MPSRDRRPGSAAVLAVLLGAGLAAAAGDEEYQVLRAYLDSPYAEKAPFEVYDRIGIYFIYNVDPKRPESIAGFFRTYAKVELDPALVRNSSAVWMYGASVHPFNP